MARPERPDFIIIGAPKAGTTALHSALAQHPEVFTTTPKEPKYWLCGDAPPPHWTGPGDAHSQQEWIWRRRDYDALFRPAAEHQVRGESTPFYLWSYPAHRRIAEHLPDVKLVAVVRDPIDRAYSNWMHLWSDGLERGSRTSSGPSPCSGNGSTPAGRRSGATATSGCTAGSSSTSIGTSTAQRVLVVRYRDIVETPAQTVDEVCRFLGIAESHVAVDPARQLAHLRRAGLAHRRCSAAPSGPAPGSGSSPRPRSGARASVPLIAQLSAGESHRPKLRRRPGSGWCRTSTRTSPCSPS